jgi:hypothetical protein
LIQTLIGTLLLLNPTLFLSSCDRPDEDFIKIQEQGSFFIGGTVIQEPGTFDPIEHGAFNPADQPSEGQTLHGDHSYVFYQLPAEARELPLVFWHGYGPNGASRFGKNRFLVNCHLCSGTGMDSLQKRGKQHPMEGKVFKAFSYDVTFLFI